MGGKIDHRIGSKEELINIITKHYGQYPKTIFRSKL